MKAQAIFLFLFSITSLAKETHDTRYYQCVGDQVEFAFFQILNENENLATIGLRGQEQEIQRLSVSNHRKRLSVKAWSENIRYDISLRKPRMLEVVNSRNGVTEYTPAFQSKLIIRDGETKESHSVSCEVFGLDKDFFDTLARAIP